MRVIVVEIKLDGTPPPSLLQDKFGRIPYNAHGGQIPPPFFLFFLYSFFFILFLGYVRLGLPRMVRKEA